MRYYVAAVYLFLYAPIALIVLFSFNAGRHAASFECCATVWYGRTFLYTFLLEALGNSLMIAFTTAVLATLMGTMAALALQQVRGVLRLAFDARTWTEPRGRGDRGARWPGAGLAGSRGAPR